MGNKKADARARQGAAFLIIGPQTFGEISDRLLQGELKNKVEANTELNADVVIS